MTKTISVIIIDYPNALQSAVQGFKELFLIANMIIAENQLEIIFDVCIVQPNHEIKNITTSDLVIIPPNLDGLYYNNPDQHLLDFLRNAHQMGSILCSACAGTFILAQTGLLNERAATTHWGLAQEFAEKYPNVDLKIESLLINDGDIISAGGLMSWIDLGLEIVAQFSKPHIMRLLGKHLIVDTGKREQRFYESFSPKLNHGNQQILSVQHHIQTHFDKSLTIAALAQLAYMSERTFLRQFTKSTHFKPVQYIQRIRVHKACELLESTTQSFEQISLHVGYDDANSFRKVFIKTMGLSPSAFKARFV